MSADIREKIKRGELMTKSASGRRSKVFEMFNLIYNQVGKALKDWYHCKKCSHLLNIPATNGFNQLHKHINSKCEFIPNKKTKPAVNQNLCELLRDVMVIGKRYRALAAEELIPHISDLMEKKTRTDKLRCLKMKAQRKSRRYSE